MNRHIQPTPQPTMPPTTHELIAVLALDAPLHPQRLARRLAGPLLVALVVSTGAVWALWGLNPHLPQTAAQPTFALKLLWLVATAVAGLWALQRLSRPGVGMGRAAICMAAATACMAGLGAAQWLRTPPQAHAALWQGVSWQTCSLSIAALSLPVLVALLWVLRQWAPTRPALTGLAAGWLAGSLAAVVYSLHCPEASLTFYALWYGAGIALAAALGACAGARGLRW